MSRDWPPFPDDQARWDALRANIRTPAKEPAVSAQTPPDTVAAITAIVREADIAFQREGGSSRHWVGECFLPLLNQAGWSLVKWQSIDSAPKDGTTILVWCPELIDGSDVARFIDGSWLARDTATLYPTLWMPIPAPETRSR